MSEQANKAGGPGEAPLVELGESVPAQSAEDPGSGSSGSGASEDLRGWRRVRAGLLVEQGKADKKVARHWQAAVQRGEFNADACAAELLAGEPAAGAPDGDAALLERCARLQRDLLMAPMLRGAKGAGRKAREATRGFVAMLVAQLVVLTIYSFVILAALLLVRAKGFGLDDSLDTILGPLSPTQEAQLGEPDSDP